MKAPHSYTKEDLVEIHSHGGILIANRLLEILFTLKELIFSKISLEKG